ncbi:MAG: asparagine synthase [Thaumarchaeota archaeon]|jgi:asparagine synthase (glutamine-hydrolysing)|nr:asparagine synthase [Nitrososphaerota archaeon]MBT3743764.1 asparagine synthase [Nitrososphaerota archaeon]MBT4057779.1 asparagine synthase [Nitrososphaerota archaeon]MBT4175310.1 asparagine synthase [Nitrososphaerota archaeon]MBT4509668.1 asparagine synthase [Nitrososphaerota archaeon]
MENDTDQCIATLQNAVSECKSEWIALSGGLDSSILAHLRKDQKPQAITIITKDFLGTDLTFAQIVAKHTRLNLSLMQVTMEEVLDSINETIKILDNFNDIEIRNSIVPHLYLSSLKKKGVDSVITGDGADEIFAGYNFLLKKSNDKLDDELERIKKIMHFPSKDIAKSLNMKVENPFLNENVIKFSDSIPISRKINVKENKKFGKWILRETFEKDLPKNIIWREKSPMQDGSGTNNLTGLFNTIITDEIFSQKKTKILEEDGVYIRTKESLHYYECFRKSSSVKKSSSDRKCPDCDYEINLNSRFCRMCGKFPID